MGLSIAGLAVGSSAADAQPERVVPGSGTTGRVSLLAYAAEAKVPIDVGLTFRRAPAVASAVEVNAPTGESSWLAPGPATASPGEQLFTAGSTAAKAIMQSSVRKDLLNPDHSVVLWRGKPRLDTGYGQGIADDAVGRARMNGAGIYNPDYFFVKLSLRFR